jgi:flagellin-like hook-associated protein FlgL
VSDGGAAITVTYQGSGVTYGETSGATISYGTASISFQLVATTASVDEVTLTQGQVITVFLQSAVGSGAGAASGSFVSVGATAATHATDITINTTGNVTNYVTEGVTTTIDALNTELDAALTTLRARTQTLGSNVALLQTRLDFTENYVNTLETGSGKLTLADLNEEGANLLALQTRQQLGISALAFAGQAEQGILGLFR